MVMDTSAPRADQAGSAQQGVNAPGLQVFVFGLFFVFGGLTSLNDVIIPKLKDLFTLNYFEVMLVNFAFFIAYLLISLPGAAIVERLGYFRTAAVGLLVMTVGCLLFIPASHSASFPVFLAALFALGSGITIVQVVANPLISLLGPPRTAHSRLTFAQAFNSLGTFLFPLVGSIIILGSLSKIDVTKLTGAALDAYRATETEVIVHTYIALAIALLLVAGVVWSARNRLKDQHPKSHSIFQALSLLPRPRFGFGAVCIFLYVGAEVAVGSLIISYMRQPSVGFLEQAGVPVGGGWLQQMASHNPIPFYWGGAMVGRIIGAYLLRVVSPGKVLATVAVGAIALILVSTHTIGLVSGWTYLAIGLMNSIMFPTIFSLASEGLGIRAAEGSGVIATAIVGGAVIPPLTGIIADSSGSLGIALILPALCYLVIAGYGIYARLPAAELTETPDPTFT